MEKIWYKAKLLPAAQSIFTEGFYPEAKRGGAQYVWFTKIDSSPAHSKILVASRMAENSFRMLTTELAKHCLEPKDKATKQETLDLNRLCSFLKDKL